MSDSATLPDQRDASSGSTSIPPPRPSGPYRRSPSPLPSRPAYLPSPSASPDARFQQAPPREILQYFKHGDRIEVHPRIRLLALHDIDSAAQTWAADVEIEYFMVHPRGMDLGLKNPVNDLLVDSFQKEEKKAFKFTLKNALDERDEKLSRASLFMWKDRGSETGVFFLPKTMDQKRGPPIPRKATAFSFTHQYGGRFRQTLDLTNFPLDSQELKIEVMLLVDVKSARFLPPAEIAWTVKEGAENANDNWVKYGDTPPLLEWTLLATIPGRTYETLPGKTGRSGRKTFSEHTFVIQVQRKYMYYMQAVVAPYLLLTTCLWSAAAIPWDDVASRLAIVTTLLLSSLAFRFVTTGLIPRVGYATLLDKFILSCLAFNVAAVVLVCLAGAVARGWRTRDTELTDRTYGDGIAWGILAAIWVCTVTYWGWKAGSLIAERRTKGKKHKALDSDFRTLVEKSPPPPTEPREVRQREITVTVDRADGGTAAG